MRAVKSPAGSSDVKRWINVALVVVLATLGPQVFAQVTFGGYQSPETVVIAEGLSSPGQIAFDVNDNLYIADTGNNRVVEETPTASGYVETVVASSGISGPQGVAVDGAGNVYIADTGSGRVLKETLAAGGSYSESVIVPNGPHRRPSNLAVDLNGNVFIADNIAGIYEETPSGGSYTESVISYASTGVSTATGVTVDSKGNVFIVGIGSNGSGTALKAVPSENGYLVEGLGVVSPSLLGAPSNIAVDSSGDVFFTGWGPAEAIEAIPANSLDYVKNIVDENLGNPTGIAVDGNGNLFIADQASNRIVEDFVWHGDFGAVNMGAASATMSILFNYSSISPDLELTPVVLTQGIAGLDFVDAGTGSCNSVGPWNPTNNEGSCTVDVTFSPTKPGSRMGAVELADSSGNVYVTGYIQGTGVGPKVTFPPGNPGTLSLSNVNSPYALAADSIGNLYVAEAVSVNSPANALVKETWTGTGYTQSTLATGLGYPVGVAVDGAGNVFVADQGAQSIIAIRSSGGSYMSGPIAIGLGTLEGVAVDGSGNVYFTSNSLGVTKETYADFTGYEQSAIAANVFATGIAVDGAGSVYLCDSTHNQALKASPSNGSYALSTIATGLNNPHGLATDALDNVYIADTGSGRLVKETLSGGSYSSSVLASGLTDPLGVALDGAGNVYSSSAAAGNLTEINFALPPVLNFTATPPGSTSSNSPQTATLMNSGNSTLEFSVPVQGFNPVIPVGFAINDSSASSCPLLDATSAAGSLAAGASCELSVSYSPQGSDESSGWLIVSDNALNQSSPGSASQSIALLVAGTPLTANIMWPTPSSITYGTALSGVQLAASSSIAGSFAYSPAIGTILTAGTHTLSVTFTPVDTTDFGLATASVTLVVNQAKPIIEWTTPLAISFGTALGSAQLDAQANMQGTFTYFPAAGSIIPAGMDTITATFTPADQTDFATISVSIKLQVGKAIPALSWQISSAIVYGTALSAMQLDATTTVPGTFIYNPTAGTILTAGTATLSVTFTPQDIADYDVANASVLLSIEPAKPVITWPIPAPITYNTPLSAIQLDAEASVPGTFSYGPGIGTILQPGLQVITANFFPTDTVDYLSATASVTILVAKARQTITFAQPRSPIRYGSSPIALTARATSSLPVTFSVISGPGSLNGPILTVRGSGDIVLAADQAGDSIYLAASRVERTIHVDKAILTVAASNLSKIYGQRHPMFTYSIHGFVDGDGSAVVRGVPQISTKAAVSSAVGEYPIFIAAGSLTARNYSFRFENGVLKVVKAHLVVTATSLTMKKGQPVPKLTYKIGGFVNGDTPAVVTGAPKLTTTATSSSPTGNYPITVTEGTLAAKNYSFTYVNGTLTVQ